MNNFFRKDYLIKGLLSSLTFFLVTSWLFFDFEPLSFVLFPAASFFVLYFKKHSMEQRRLDLITGFKDALQYMKNGLDAGSSPERSLTNAVKGLESLYGEKAEITKNFKKMSVRISTGITME